MREKRGNFFLSLCGVTENTFFEQKSDTSNNNNNNSYKIFISSFSSTHTSYHRLEGDDKR